jgi:hypothetical protein
VDPNAAYAPKTSTDDDDPDAAHAPIVRGRKDPYKMMRLFQKGKDPASFLSREGVNEEVPPVEGNGIDATQVSNQDTVVLLYYP